MVAGAGWKVEYKEGMCMSSFIRDVVVLGIKQSRSGIVELHQGLGHIGHLPE